MRSSQWGRLNESPLLVQVERVVESVIPVQETILLTGDVIARDVSYDQFLADYDGLHVEWVYGAVIQMPTVGPQHNRLTRFLIGLLENYLVLSSTGGDIFHDPMVMKTSPDLPGRAPDVFVLLPHKAHFIRQSDVAGPADLVIEVVSPGSQRQDRIDKYREYEQGGVPEYWLLDPTRREVLFYQRNPQGVYELIAPDEHGIYHSRVLPKLRLNVNLLWDEFLPQGPEITRLVEAMLREAE